MRKESSTSVMFFSLPKLQSYCMSSRYWYPKLQFLKWYQINIDVYKLVYKPVLEMFFHIFDPHVWFDIRDWFCSNSIHPNVGCTIRMSDVLHSSKLIRTGTRRCRLSGTATLWNRWLVPTCLHDVWNLLGVWRDFRYELGDKINLILNKDKLEIHMEWVIFGFVYFYFYMLSESEGGIFS